MKVLFLSDTLFDDKENPEIYKKMTDDTISDKEFIIYERTFPLLQTIDSYKQLICEIKPDLILFGGDYTHGFFPREDNARIEDFLGLLHFINKEEIQCFFIEGNWDMDYYDVIQTKTNALPYVEDISNRVVNFRDKKILGLSYSFTHSIKQIRKIKETFPEEYDIVLSHTELGRRIWLFNLNAKFILTGHCGNSLEIVRDKILVALDGSPIAYVVFDFLEDKELVKFYYDKSEMTINLREETPIVNIEKKPLNESILMISNSNYKWIKDEIFSNRVRRMHYFDEMLNLKEVFDQLSDSEKEKKVEELLQIGYRKYVIYEYLGWGFYKCEICQRRFYTKTHLANHKKSHNQ